MNALQSGHLVFVLIEPTLLKVSRFGGVRLVFANDLHAKTSRFTNKCRTSLPEHSTYATFQTMKVVMTTASDKRIVPTTEPTMIGVTLEPEESVCVCGYTVSAVLCRVIVRGDDVCMWGTQYQPCYAE